MCWRTCRRCCYGGEFWSTLVLLVDSVYDGLIFWLLLVLLVLCVLILSLLLLRVLVNRLRDLRDTVYQMEACGQVTIPIDWAKKHGLVDFYKNGISLPPFCCVAFN